MLLRIIASIVLLTSILFAPFWVSAVLALISMAYFPLFIEAVFLFLISDLLYGISEVRFFNIVLISSVASILFLILIEFLKSKLKFYA